MELQLNVTEDDSENSEHSQLSICAAEIVSETEYQRISQAVQIAADVMHLEPLPLLANGCLFHWRSLTAYGLAYAHAFQSIFEFLGMELVIHLRMKDSVSQGLSPRDTQLPQVSMKQHDDRH